MPTPRHAPVPERIVRHLARTPGLRYSAQEIADTLYPRVPVATVRHALTALSRRGRVRRDASGTGHPAHYWADPKTRPNRRTA